MIDLLLKPVPLTQHSDGYLHYGDICQIVSPGPTCATAVHEHPFKRGHCRLSHLALSCSVPPSSIDHAPYLSTDSIISASPLLFPVVRNSFVIEHGSARCPEEKVGEVVKYGDVFRIRALPTQHFTLYLFSAPAIRLHHAATHSAKPKVRFSDVKTTETLWSCWPVDEMEQLKMELGLGVPLKKTLFLRQNGTGINLSTEPNFPVLTYFGNELEVTVDNKRDSKTRKPSYQNYWYFDTERGRPRPDECLKQFMDQSKVDASHNAQMVDKMASLEEKRKEEWRKEKEEDEREGEEGEDEEGRECYMKMLRNLPIDEKRFRGTLREREESRDKTAGGQLLYDKRTGPQPGAYQYKVFKDDPYFPNTKWDCGQTDCCNLRPPARPVVEEVKAADCSPCECIDTEEPLPNPNFRYTTLKPLLR